ncbi:MAG: FecR domain-containing protein [Methylophilus sp.]|uniref:FecR domain-containing protein n=1 Tax=Methylophilus sp. TaxID=29541 RepID=UPI003F9EDF2D
MNQPRAMNHSGDYAGVQQQALEWQVLLWSGEVTAAEQQSFEEWLTASDLHQQAWREIAVMQQKLQLVPDRAIALLKDETHSAKRRRLLQMLGLAVVTTGTVPLVRNSENWQTLVADYRTHTGQQEKIMLADGSQLMMNTATSVDIAYSDHERRLILRQGEIFISTAADELRPLLVQTPHGTAQALGTQFNVRLKPHETRVSVHQGQVKLRPERGAPSLVIASGHQAGFSNDSVTNLTPTTNESAWLDGKLVAEQMRLGAFLDELSRYRSGVIRYDQTVADMAVSGVFPLLDTDRVLQSLLQALPLRIDYFSSYWVTVHAV